MDHVLPSGVPLTEAAPFLLFIFKCFYSLSIMSFLILIFSLLGHKQHLSHFCPGDDAHNYGMVLLSFQCKNGVQRLPSGDYI